MYKNNFTSPDHFVLKSMYFMHENPDLYTKTELLKAKIPPDVLPK